MFVKRFLIISWVFLLPWIPLMAQSLSWAKNYKGAVADITLDPQGNVISVGEFVGTIDFDPGTGTSHLTSEVSPQLIASHIYVQKLDSLGNFIWAKGYGSFDTKVPTAINTDRFGNIYVCGFFTDSIDLDPDSNMVNRHFSQGQTDAFVQKLDPNGNLIWVKSFGGDWYVYANEIEIDANGNVYTIGTYYDTIDVDPGPNTHYLITSNGTTFIQKLDSNGFFQWAWADSTGLRKPTSSLDAQGNIYVIGRANYLSLHNQSCAIHKISPTGQKAWSKRFGNHSSIEASSITTDIHQNLLITGVYSGGSDFDPGPGSAILGSAGGGDIFILKMSPSGSYIWAKGFGGSETDEGLTIATDAKGNIYTGGTFRDSVDFDPGAGSTIRNSGIRHPFTYTNLFVQALDSMGHFLWVTTAGNNSSSSNVMGLEINQAGHLYASGRFGGNLDFDPGPGTTILSSTSGTTYVLNYQPLLTGIGQIEQKITATLYPNPVQEYLSISLDQSLNNVQLNIIDANGRMVESHAYFQLSSTSIRLPEKAGIYLIQISSSQGSIIHRIIKQ